jgi:hypothetical protein
VFEIWKCADFFRARERRRSCAQLSRSGRELSERDRTPP